MRTAFALILLFISLSIYAQHDFRSGYIVKANGDSLTGWVAYPTTKTSFKFCIYKATKKSTSTKFSPLELLAYGMYEDKRFESKVLIKDSNSNSAFLEVLVKGELSLYMANNIFYYERDSLVELPSVSRQLFNSGNGTYVRTGKLYVGVLNILLNECNLRADDTEYEQRDLINLVQNYNRCLGEEGFVYKRDLPWTKFSYQLSGGVTLSTLQMESYGSISFDQSTGGFFGASVEVSMPRINEKFFFSLEAIYYKSLFQGYKENLQPTGIRSDLIFDMSLLKLPLGIRFNLLSDYNTPFIKAGAVGIVDIGSTYKIITEEESSGTVITSIVDNKLDSRSQIGFWLSMGYQIGISGRYKIYVETKYEKMFGYFYGEFQTPIEYNNLNVSIGLRY